VGDFTGVGEITNFVGVGVGEETSEYVDSPPAWDGQINVKVAA
jgi:hypothetical protein